MVAEPLTAAEEELKEQVLAQGFGAWSRKDFNAFVRGCEVRRPPWTIDGCWLSARHEGFEQGCDVTPARPRRSYLDGMILLT